MRFSRRLIVVAGFAAVVGTSLAVVHGEPPATDARLLESAVDRLGLLAAAPTNSSRTGQRASSQGTNKASRQSKPGGSATRAPQRGLAQPSTRSNSPSTSRRNSTAVREPAAGSLKPLTPAGNEVVLVSPEATAADLDPINADTAAELSSDQLALRNRLRRVLGLYYPKQLNTRDHNPWEVMHGIIAFGVDAKLRRGGPEGDPVNAIAYLSTNGRMNGLQLLLIDRGRINADKGPKVQGHYGQLLAILAQSRVKTDYPLKVNGKRFTLADLIETEKLTCRSGIELTFKLISFAHYLDSDETWLSETGETWDIPKLIAEELKQPILSNAACGGTHRLMGFAYAVRNRKKQKRPIDGQWLRAEKYLDEYHNYTFALQSADGSFSTEWFRRREAKDDINRRLQTTGHILEWMVYSLPEKQLDDPRLVRAVSYLTRILAAEPNREWEIGPLGHALHGLSIYDYRRYKPLDEKPAALARRTSKPAAAEKAEAPLDESVEDEADEPAETSADDSADEAADRSAASPNDDGPVLRIKR